MPKRKGANRGPKDILKNKLHSPRGIAKISSADPLDRNCRSLEVNAATDQLSPFTLQLKLLLLCAGFHPLLSNPEAAGASRIDNKKINKLR